MNSGGEEVLDGADAIGQDTEPLPHVQMEAVEPCVRRDRLVLQVRDTSLDLPDAALHAGEFCVERRELVVHTRLELIDPLPACGTAR